MNFKLNDRGLRDRLLDQIRGAHGEYAAAKIVGVSPETYRKYKTANPDFADEVEAARNASVEPLMRMLHQEGEAGDITAAKEWLKHNAPPPRSEEKKIAIEVTHGADPATLKTIDDLRARLEGRTALALPPAEEDYEEAEIVEDD